MERGNDLPGAPQFASTSGNQSAVAAGEGAAWSGAPRELVDICRQGDPAPGFGGAEEGGDLRGWAEETPPHSPGRLA